jgi:hypothetical protein
MVKYANLANYCNKLYNAFEYCFELLPIATLINKKVLVIHGGLSRHAHVTLEHIEIIKVSLVAFLRTCTRVLMCMLSAANASDTLSAKHRSL